MSKKVIPLNTPSNDENFETKVLFNKLLEHEVRLGELEQDQSLVKELKLEVKELKDQVGEVIVTQNNIDNKIKSIAETINGIRKHFKDEVQNIGKGIVRFRYWLIGIVITCTMATMTIWNVQNNRFQDSIRKDIGSMESSIRDANKDINFKIDSANKRTDDNFKTIIKLMKR